MIRWTTDPDAGETRPGYCATCGRYALLGPQGACVNSPSCTQNLQPPEPHDGPHHCNTSTRRREGQPAYRQCTCGQWLWAGSGYWYRVNHPPARWLRHHGLNTDDTWYAHEDTRPADPYGEMHYTATRIWYQLRAILRALRG